MMDMTAVLVVMVDVIDDDDVDVDQKRYFGLSSSKAISIGSRLLSFPPDSRIAKMPNNSSNNQQTLNKPTQVTQPSTMALARSQT